MRDVWILTLAQACAACGTIVLVSFGGIIGTTLAPVPALATLPLSFSVLGVALTSIPAALLMQRTGRKPALIGSALVAAAASLLCAVSVATASFVGLCVAGFLLGANMAFVQQYRFAAAEFVSEQDAGRAVSTVMLGTLAAAILAPELGNRARLLGGWPEFTGSFVALAAVCGLAALILSALGQPAPRLTTVTHPARPLTVIARQPAFVTAVLAGATSYGVMTFIMTATPISMHVVDGMPVDDTKSVISLHLLGMYVPSLASGWLVRTLGVPAMMLTGLAFMATCVAIDAFVGQHFMHYASALLLLGIGWNFLFVAGTTLLTTSYAPSERYRAQGLNDLVVFGTQATVSLAAGSAIMRLGWPSLNLTIAPLIVLMAVAAVRLGTASRATSRAVAAP